MIPFALAATIVAAFVKCGGARKVVNREVVFDMAAYARDTVKYLMSIVGEEVRLKKAATQLFP